MSLVPNNAGLGGGTAHHAWNTPPIQLAESFGRPGLSPKIAPSLPPTQPPSTVVEGVVSAFVKICQRWRLSVDQQVILLGYKGNDFLGRQILESDITFASAGRSRPRTTHSYYQLGPGRAIRECRAGRAGLVECKSGRSQSTLAVGIYVGRSHGQRRGNITTGKLRKGLLVAQ